MILVGCDLHTRKQQVALLNTDTGELRDQELSHDSDAVERFYAALPPPVTVGIESTGYSLWFHALLHQESRNAGSSPELSLWRWDEPSEDRESAEAGTRRQGP